MRSAIGVVAVATTLALGGISAVALEASGAAGCAATVTITQTANNTVVITPASVKITLGACVTFANKSKAAISVKVNRGDATLYGPATIKKGATSAFTPKTAGANTVTATSTILLIRFHSSSHVTVVPRASAKPSPTPSATGKHTAKPAKSPVVAPSPKHKHHKKKVALGLPTGITLPPLPPLPSNGLTALPKGSNPVVAPGPTSASPTPTQSSSPAAAIVAGPIEPPPSNQRGLPIVVGLVMVLGLAAGWGRVLLAHPLTAGQTSAVDNRLRPAHRV